MKFSFSGGPLIRHADRALIGVTSYAELIDPKTKMDYPVKVQIFTNIFYYFDWIAEVTGFDLPKCAHS